MKKEEIKNDSWIKICLLPLIIGFSLVVANTSMVYFKIIGWFLLIFGVITGYFYLSKSYKTHREKILKFLRKIYLLKPKEESKKENEQKK